MGAKISRGPSLSRGTNAIQRSLLDRKADRECIADLLRRPAIGRRISAERTINSEPPRRCGAVTKRASIYGVLLCIVLAQTAWADFAAGKRAYENGEYATALKELRPLADQGYANAQAYLGYMYSQGRGVAQDYAEAVRWYRKAADQGYAFAQVNLGVMYLRGLGVAQEHAEAVRWFRKAAEQDYPDAQYQLGIMYLRGPAVAQDHAEAARWFRKAAERGHAGAQASLGLSYESGMGVARDYAEAARWYRKAAEQGHAVAQSRLGVLYAKGQGVPEDHLEAHMWLSLAASRAGGDDLKKYAAARDAVATLMTAEQIAEAQRRAREWKPKGGEE